ncbi:conserved hypothetical protein [Hyella patelloides LEGE 07179]|uniref:Uncharacterized protein n=1 Tax=Hyella patelloides LEGE 07179 TaxID=945734 RepID=A0A563VMX3_9CYAN|nr:hypothetical protein [Hyella patelloides]VEP12717.1 conserved hypothetical protein [Hyella patelloides LEGE 07179]
MLHNISTAIKITFFKFLARQITITYFEKWVYQTADLEQALKPDDYIELLSLDFTQEKNKYYSDCRYKITKIIEKYINIAEYNTWKLEKLLHDFLDRKGNLAEILKQFYYLYCHDYGFLKNLGLYYLCLYYSHDFSNHSLERSSAGEIAGIEENLSDILPEVDGEIQKVLSWLKQGKIKIINDVGSIYGVDYIDNRIKSKKSK